MPEEAIQTVVAAVGLPDEEIVDDELVAGYPAKRYQVNGFQTQGVEVAIDVISFTDDMATYLIYIQNQEPASAEKIRTVDIPALLGTVTVGAE
jgi:hypothetical protein